VTTREFTRRFARYRVRAAHGERIRISTPEGNFLFTREPQGLPVRAMLKRWGQHPGKGFFAEQGAERIEAARAQAPEARSPWD